MEEFPTIKRLVPCESLLCRSIIAINYRREPDISQYCDPSSVPGGWLPHVCYDDLIGYINRGWPLPRWRYLEILGDMITLHAAPWGGLLSSHIKLYHIISTMQGTSDHALFMRLLRELTGIGKLPPSSILVDEEMTCEFLLTISDLINQVNAILVEKTKFRIDQLQRQHGWPRGEIERKAARGLNAPEIADRILMKIAFDPADKKEST